MKERFRVPFTLDQMSDLLMVAYRAEVEFRHRVFIEDDATRDHIRAFASFLTTDSKEFGVLLCGMCGNGKTTLLRAFQSVLNSFNDAGIFGCQNIGISIIDSIEFSHLSADYMRFKQLRGIDMIAIEDLGREPREILNYGNIFNPVIDCLEYRYSSQLFTLISTNLTPKQIRDCYGARIADRLNEMLVKIVFKNASYRF